jgi:hypothetical protein
VPSARTTTPLLMIRAYWRRFVRRELHGFPEDRAGPISAVPVTPLIDPEKAQKCAKQGARRWRSKFHG